MRKTSTLDGWKIALAGTLVLCAGVLMPSSHGDGDPSGFSRELGEGDWRDTGRSDNQQNYCDTNAAGTICVEWCELDGTPSGMLCCIDPNILASQLPGQGTMGQCQHWVPLLPQ